MVFAIISLPHHASGVVPLHGSILGNRLTRTCGRSADWGEEDAKTVVRRVLGLDTIEQMLVLDGILLSQRPDRGISRPDDGRRP